MIVKKARLRRSMNEAAMTKPFASSTDLAPKKETLEVLAPQVISAGNIGCMMQIGSGTSVPVVHTVELLDWATGGPKPRALGGR